MKALLTFIWDKSPAWVKWPLALLSAPAIGMYLFLGWHTESIHATIRPYAERRDAQIQAIEKVRAVELNAINDNLKTISQQQSIMYQEMLRRNP